MKNFEERLERLEKLGEDIRRSELPLDDALKAFEEGIRLARSLERDLEKLEGKVQVLLNGDGDAAVEDDKPELDLFADGD